MAKNKAFWALFVGFAVLIGCAGEGAGYLERWINDIDFENGEYTVLYLGPGGFLNAYYEGWVYTSGYNGLGLYTSSIYRMRLDGTEKQKVVDEHYLNQNIYHDGWLYYVGDSAMTIGGVFDYDKFIEGAYGGALYRMRLDGSERMQYPGVYGVFSYVIKDEWIYFRSGFDLYRIRTSGGGGLEKLADNCSRFIIAQEYLFFTYGGTTGGAAQYDTKIIRCNLDGTGKTILIKDEMIVFTPVFVDSGYLYYTLYFGDYYVADFNGYEADWKTSRRGMALHRMKIDGTERQTIVRHSSDGYSLRNIVLKNGYIYYSRLDRITNDNNDTSYHKVRPDGTDHVLLCDKLTNYQDGFEIVGDYIYYHASPEELAGLYRVPINGGSPEVMYTYIKYFDYYTGYFTIKDKFFITLR